jgi:hypothetical protein
MEEMKALSDAVGYVDPLNKSKGNLSTWAHVALQMQKYSGHRMIHALPAFPPRSAEQYRRKWSYMVKDAPSGYVFVYMCVCVCVCVCESTYTMYTCTGSTSMAKETAYARKVAMKLNHFSGATSHS